MEDLLTDACRWHVQAEALEYRAHVIDHFRDRHSVLLGFLHVEGLLRDPSFGECVQDWSAFEI